MKILMPVDCPECGTNLQIPAVGREPLQEGKCPECKALITPVQLSSISVIAHRLFWRAETELRAGDHTHAILLSAIAIEGAFTEILLRWKKTDHVQHQSIQDQHACDKDVKIRDKVPEDNQEKEWEKEVPRGGFQNLANSVAECLVGLSFDDFIAEHLKTYEINPLIAADSLVAPGNLKLNFIYKQLFERRNRIMHWGEIDYKEAGSRAALMAGRTAYRVLELMNNHRYEAVKRKGIQDRELTASTTPTIEQTSPPSVP